MTIFYTVLFGLTIFVFISEYKRDDKKISIFTTTFLILVLSVVAGSRTSFVDTGSYVYAYENIETIEIFNESYEPGFVLLFKILYFISENPQFMIFTTSLITNGLIIITLRRYSEKISKTSMIYMYITAGTFISTMNGIRQYLAVAIMFYFTFLIEEKKIFKYLIVTFICMTLHSSALVMIPIYFIVNNKAWSKKIYILILIFIIAMIFFDPIINLLFELIGGKFGGYKDFNEGGANILRVAVVAVTPILAFLTRKKFKDNKFNENLFVNMSLINLLVMIVSLKNWIFARFGMYIGLYDIILLSYIMKNNLSSKEKRIVRFMFLVCYFIFFWYEARVAGIKYIGLL